MKLIAATILFLASGAINAQIFEWSLSDTAYNAATEVMNIHITGGDDAVVQAIKECHARITVGFSFNAATARCLAMDMTGRLMAMQAAQDPGIEAIHDYYKKNEDFLDRNLHYLVPVNSQGDAIIQTIKSNVVAAVPALEGL